jgi:hypothetical protein
MKKITITAFITLIITPLLFSVAVQAATDDFTANADITVPGVTIDTSTGAVVDMIIFSGSTAESWTFDSGIFTVVNPGTFNVGSSDPAVRAIQITKSGTQVSCKQNTTAGTTQTTLPTTAATYKVVPRSNDCSGGGSVSTGSGSSGSSGSSGGGGGSSYQSYNPSTGELTVDGETTTTTPTASTPSTAPASAPSGDTNIVDVKAEATKVATMSRAEVAAAAGKAIDTALEAKYDADIVGRVVASEANVSSAVRDKIVTFVTYGSKTTDKLGAGERGGVVNSFKEAFGKLPESEIDWEDVVKIANGRWPGQTDAARESVATGNFEAIYLRSPDRTNPNDDAAVVILSYGLRSRNRNLDSERAAIKIYEDIFNRIPQTATAWDAVRAIAYSGATR